VFLGEGTARASFQITLERRRTFPITKSDGGFNSPRFELRGVGDFTSMVSAQAAVKVIGQTRDSSSPSLVETRLRDHRPRLQRIVAAQPYPKLRLLVELQAARDASQLPELPSEETRKALNDLLGGPHRCACDTSSMMARCFI